MINAIQVNPDGSATHVEIDGLDDMQRIVGGLIDFVANPEDDFEVIVNDEGLLMNLELNTLASILSGRRLVGPAILVGRADSEGNTTSVPKGLMKDLHLASLMLDMAGKPVGDPSWEQVK